MEFGGPFAVFMVSLVPFPLCYILNTQKWMQEPAVVLAVGVIVLTLILVVPLLAVNRMKKPNFILKVMSLFMLSSMVDLIIALEADGYIGEMMSFYLKDGEPYLWTGHGTFINYWDGTVHYFLCLWILYCTATGRDYRKAGLFWAGSIINSVIVIAISSAIGKFGVYPATILNVPYLFVPIWIAYKLLQTRDEDTKPDKTGTGMASIFSRPLDMLLIVYFLFATTFDVFRGCIALGSQDDLLQEYLHDHEPYLMDPVGFPKAQMIVNMMYFIPYYACAICGLLFPGQTWLPDWALLFAGASAQAQFSHMGASFHWRTDPEFHVPARSHSRLVFWIVNIILFVGPQIFALRQNSSINSDNVSKKKRS